MLFCKYPPLYRIDLTSQRSNQGRRNKTTIAPPIAITPANLSGTARKMA